MSNAEKRNGTRVQRAIYALSVNRSHNGHAYVTAGQVAIEAECSAPTAMKYLKVLAEHGLVSHEKLFNGYNMFAWKGN